MADEPIFYGRNWIDRFAAITPDSGAAVVGRIYDQDDSLLWSSSGDNSDAVNSTIEVDFLDEAGVAATRQIDTIVFQGWNVKSGKVQYWNGSAWTDIGGAATFSGQAASYLVISGLNVSTQKLLFTFSTTQTANQEKTVGEILALQTLFGAVSSRGFRLLSQSWIPAVNKAAMLDKGLAFASVRWAGARTRRWSAKVQLPAFTSVNVDSFFSSVIDNQTFYVCPEPAQRPDRFYFCTHVGGTPSHGYLSQYKAAGETMAVDLLEVDA